MTQIIHISQLRLRNPLIWKDQGNFVVEGSQKNIFLGGGVATKTQISKAVPFDLLGFMLTAEQVKREVKSSVHMLIADQHAWLANNLNKSIALTAANKLITSAQRIVDILKLHNWHIHQASKIFLEQKETYEKLEMRDVNHFVHNHRVGVKIGWAFSPKEKGITDESHFDPLHSLPTILIKPGLTLDPLKLHESPYICTSPEVRVVIQHGEKVEGKIQGAVTNHLSRICSLFETLIAPFPAKTPLEQKIIRILGTISIGG